MTPLIMPIGLFRLISGLVWRLPGAAARKMAEFSHVEAGSGLDMLAATEHESEPMLRRKYYRHALDELKHASMFRERARALADNGSRAHAVLEDTGYIAERGIRSLTPLVEQLSQAEFFAFIWLHERAGATQFDFYAELLRHDADSTQMFEEIARDERFHIAYSRAELDRLADGGTSVRVALFRTRAREVWQAWTRLTSALGERVAGVWLSTLYFLVIGPCALLARERLPGGLTASAPSPNSRAYAERLA